MTYTFKDCLPLAEDFISADEQTALDTMLEDFIKSARQAGFKDMAVASSLIQSAVSRLAAADPAIMYDWSMAHMRLLQEEHTRWRAKPKRLIKPRDLRADHIY